MLNNISDDAAAKLKRFYQQQLDSGVNGWAKYEAHLFLGLLHWRDHGNAGVDELKRHMAEAAVCVALLYAKRKSDDQREDNGAVEFLIPLFVVLIFGDEQSRRTMSEVDRCYWSSGEPAELQSMILFLDLLRRYLVRISYPDGEVQAVLEANRRSETHSFYQPWIDAFCTGILAINSGDTETIEVSCERLDTLHRKEATTGDWQLHVEGLMNLWGSGLLRIARWYGLTVETESRYLYNGSLKAKL